MRIPYNYVLIRPDKDYETYVVAGRDTGIYAGLTVENGGTVKAVMGEVVEVCENLRFNGGELQAMRKNFSNDMTYVSEMSKVREASALYDVPIEIKKGDRVSFEYTEHFHAHTTGLVYEDCLLIKYDKLTGRVDGEQLYPLNGKILVEAVERDKAHRLTSKLIEIIQLQDKKSFDTLEFLKGGHLQIGKVLSVGAKVKAYLDFPGERDGWDPEAGCYVAYRWAHAEAFEADLHKTMYGNKKIFVLNRKDVDLYFQGEDALKSINI